MYCPKCEAEYRRGSAQCSVCRLPLVDGRPTAPRSGSNSDDLEVVFADGRANLVAIAKSILMSAGIEYAVHGERVQELFGYGRFPAGFNPLVGPVQILVSASDAVDARALLEHVASPDSSAVPVEGDLASSEESSASGPLSLHVRAIAKIAAALLLAMFLLNLVFGALSR